MKTKSSNSNKTTKQKNRRVLYSFEEARNIVRSHGFGSVDEFMNYDCPGSYHVGPKDNLPEIYPKEWNGWDDFLGIPWNYETSKSILPTYQLHTQDDYHMFMEQIYRYRRERGGGDLQLQTKTNELILVPSHTIDAILYRLPYQPELYYKNNGWIGWDDFLSVLDEKNQ